MFNRRDSFAKFDLDTLLFAFYYKQGSYQQYLAAVELKKKNWMFHKKYHTWFRRADPNEPVVRVRLHFFIFNLNSNLFCHLGCP